jgi:hypothetical protein
MVETQANGGIKLMSFGIVYHRKNGHQGSDNWHGYIPLIFARVLEEKLGKCDVHAVCLEKGSHGSFYGRVQGRTFIKSC